MNGLASNYLAITLALIVGASAPVLAAEEAHTTHSKQMKNDAGMKEGEEMKNTRATGTGSTTPLASKHCMGHGKTHATHSKRMKSGAGVKEGDSMDDTDCANEMAHSHPEKLATGNTHTTHSKQMKNDQGIKDGEPMENTR